MNNYVPLYRKYRPQTFADLIGQESVVKTLSNAIETGRISHAYLFTGPRGTGKTSSARILAKSLNCVEGPSVTPCGKCPSCIEIAASNSVDVIEIDAASNRKVEDARNLLERVHFVPVAGKYKIYIIDEVHMLTTEAFNTLLKTLEEPPKNLIFILATTESHKVLNTIISRCQRFDFKRVTQELTIARLKEIAREEDIKINDKALQLIAKKAYGGMRDALGLLDQASVLANIGDEINENDIISLFGSLSEDLLLDISDNLAQRDTVKLLENADLAVQSCEPINVIRELVNYFRSMLIIKTSAELDKIRHLIEFSTDIIPAIKQQSEHFETDEVVQIIEKLCEYEKTIKTTHQQQLWLEISLLSICHRQDMQIIRDLQARVENLENGRRPEQNEVSLPPPPAKPPEVQMITPAPKPAKDKPKEEESDEQCAVIMDSHHLNGVDSPAEAWKKLLCSFKKEDFPSRAFYQIFKPVEINAEKIVITCTNEKWVDKARAEKLKPLEDAAKILFSANPHIIIRTPQPGDQIEEKKTPELEKTIIEPPKPKPSSQIAIDVEEHAEIETEVAKELDEMDKEVVPLNVSDQCKMVLDIFNGKIVE